MSRSANTNLKNATQRSRLVIKNTPHCENLAPGRVLGYLRDSKAAAGTWLVRVQVIVNGQRKRLREQLGTADDLVVANGVDILSYDQAYAKAAASKVGEQHTAKGRVFTLRDAIEQHKNYGGKSGNKTTRAKAQAFNSLRWNVLGLEWDLSVREGFTIVRGLVDGKTPSGPWALDGNLAVNDLTTELLQALRDSWIDEDNNASRATALRSWTNLHSCLEQAFKKPSNGIGKQVAWKNVPALNQHFEPRLLHFTDEDAVAIIGHAYTLDQHVGEYLEGLYRAGTRPGSELFSLRVQDFRPSQRTLTIQGRSETVAAKTGGRTIGLAPTALAFFSRIAAGRKASEPLFTSDGVNAWVQNSRTNSDRIKKTLVAAVRHVLGEAAFKGAGRLTDEDIVPYAFRHTFISRRAARGMPAGQLGKVCGTSEYMIQKTYAKFFPAEAEQWLIDTDVKTPLRNVA